MSIQVVIPDNDPMIPLLEQRAARRGFGSAAKRPQERKALRKRLPKLVRELVRERLGELNQHGDPMEATTEAVPSS